MTDLEQLERQLEDSKTLIERREMAHRLHDNREFRELILNQFCVEECARYARESGDPALTAEQRADALAMAQAAGHLKRFLSIVVLMGNTAEGQSLQINDMIDELRAEED